MQSKTQILILVICLTSMTTIIDAATVITVIEKPDLIPILSELDLLHTFIANDTTDSHPFIVSGPDNYVCTMYAADLAQNLTDAGWVAGIIVRSAKYHDIGCGHVLTWCICNGSLHVIEPTNDGIVDADGYNTTVDRDIYVLRYESVESGHRKAIETWQRNR